jgi:hypothetical protein
MKLNYLLKVPFWWIILMSLLVETVLLLLALFSSHYWGIPLESFSA